MTTDAVSTTSIETRPLMRNANDSGVYKAIHVEYQEMASWYDKFWASYLDKTLVKPLALLQDGLVVVRAGKAPSRVTVVDVGCGTGVFLKRFIDETQQHSDGQQQLPKLIGIEPSVAMLEQARVKFADNDYSSMVEFKTAPAEKLPLADESVDIVCSTNAFHFFRNKEAALGEIKRVLKKGGRLVITDWCNDYLLVKLYHNVIERLRWIGFKEGYPGPLGSKRMLELVKAAGFDNVSIETYTVRFWLFVTWGMHTITATKNAGSSHHLS